MPASNIWGSDMWQLLLFTNYYADTCCLESKRNPEDTQRITNLLIELYDSLQWVLPCYQCREHYSKYLSEYNIYDILWPQPGGENYKLRCTRQVWNLHNWVNKELGKKEFSWTNLLRKLPPQFSKQSLQSLLKIILRDDICDPTTQYAQISSQTYKNSIFLKTGFVPDIDPRVCIAEFQLSRFAKCLINLFEIYKVYNANDKSLVFKLDELIQTLDRFLKTKK